MQYFGGKARTCSKISDYINQFTYNRDYIEPFVGGAWVFSKIKSPNKTAYDICEPLIKMYRAVQKGWVPPSEVSEDLYKAAKAGEVSEELRAFIGFGCSFAGKWFGGYARDGKGRNYAQNAKNSLMKKYPGFCSGHFYASDYRELKPDNCVIYCDPPYKGTTGYDAAGDFDTEEFWDIIRTWSKNNLVFVSEYQAPEDFECVLAIETKTDIRTRKAGKEPRIEKLFKFKGV